MATKSLPVELEQTVYVGADLLREYRWFPDGVTPQNFTGWSATMLIGPPRGTAIRQLTTANGGITLGTDGLITVTLPAAQTLDLTGQLDYVLDLIDPDGRVMRFLRGRVVIVRDVSPP